MSGDTSRSATRCAPTPNSPPTCASSAVSRAERFWAANVFAEVRVREAVDTGGRLHDVRVLVKPLASGGLATYLGLVPRDRPGSALP